MGGMGGFGGMGGGPGIKINGGPGGGVFMQMPSFARGGGGMGGMMGGGGGGRPVYYDDDSDDEDDYASYEDPEYVGGWSVFCFFFVIFCVTSEDGYS